MSELFYTMVASCEKARGEDDKTNILSESSMRGKDPDQAEQAKDKRKDAAGKAAASVSAVKYGLPFVCEFL